jgi:hypothetical protein
LSSPCSLCPMLPVSRDYLFLIARSVFSNPVSRDYLFLIACSVFSNVYLLLNLKYITKYDCIASPHWCLS